MKSLFKYISSALAIAVLGATMTSCDDWTEPEHVDLNYGTVEDSPNYQKYLENLRAYRQKDHKKIYVWFDNVTDAFGTQGDRISAVPDSVDVIVLQNPDGVTNQMQAEMKKLSEQKGIEFGYCISFSAIRAAWTLTCEDLAAKRLDWEKEYGDAPVPAELQDPDFSVFLIDYWTEKLRYFNSVGFDCLMAAYDGKATNHMTPAELAEYTAQTALFFNILNDWHQRNPEVAIDYVGRPQYVADLDIVNDFRQVFLSGSLDATSYDGLTQVYAAAQGSVPDSKIGMVAAFRALDTAADPKTGFFADGTLAVEGLGTWAAAHNVGAAGVTNVSNDYFVTNGQYTTIRQFIQKINPAAK